MRRQTVTAALVLLLCLAGFNADAVTLYVKRAVAVEKGDLLLGDLVQGSGDVRPDLARALDRRIGEVADAPLVIPSRAYRALCESGLGEGFILVGTRTLVVVKGSAAERDLPLLDSLVDFLEEKGVLADAPVELDGLRILGAPPDAMAGNPVFRISRVDGASPFPRTADIGFTLPVSSGGTKTGRILLTIREENGIGAFPEEIGARAAGVKANEPVDVLFHKGAITIRMQGRVLATAPAGSRVDVYVSASRKNFSGIVTEDKAVDVEIP
jgi:hypothetical protein